MRRLSGDGLPALFGPSSVAVIGASDDAAKVGGRVLAYLTSGRYRGRVYPVNSKQRSVMGRPAFPSIDDIDEPLDTAIIALPPAACVAVVRQCAVRSVKSAIVLTAGFAEAGADGAARQAQIAGIVASSPLRLLGPNCLGLVNEDLGYAATFATMWKEEWAPPGPVGIVSQSGATASYLYVMLRERGIGTSLWCSTGNELDVDVAECIRYLAGNDRTRVIVAALEGVKDGRALVAALDVARSARKPVVLIKVGRSKVGSDAVRSHTGALSGDDRVFTAAVEQAGALRCASFDEAVDVVAACAVGRHPAGPRVGLVSASGGAGILMADWAEDLGLTVPELSRDVRARVEAIVPGCASRNPVDVTAMVLNDLQMMVEPPRIIGRSGEVDAVVAFLTSAFRSDESIGRVIEALCAGRTADDVPLLLSAYTSTANLRRLFVAGLPTYIDPARAMVVLAALARFTRSWTRAPSSCPPPGALALPPLETESDLLEFFRAHGVPATPSRTVTSRGQAGQVADELGFPVAMKVCVPGLAHKADVGGVRTRIAERSIAEDAFDGLAAVSGRIAPNRPPAVTVQKMANGPREMMMGFRLDSTFGPVVVLGFGGSWVEIVDDVAVRIAPIDRAEAARMIDSLRGRRLLDGARGQPPADVDALADALAAFAMLAAAFEGVESAEINPFVLGAPGEGGVAVDAKLVMAAGDPTSKGGN